MATRRQLPSMPDAGPSSDPTFRGMSTSLSTTFSHVGSCEEEEWLPAFRAKLHRKREARLIELLQPEEEKLHRESGSLSVRHARSSVHDSLSTYKLDAAKEKLLCAFEARKSEIRLQLEGEEAELIECERERRKCSMGKQVGGPVEKTSRSQRGSSKIATKLAVWMTPSRIQESKSLLPPRDQKLKMAEDKDLIPGTTNSGERMSFSLPESSMPFVDSAGIGSPTSEGVPIHHTRPTSTNPVPILTNRIGPYHSPLPTRRSASTKADADSEAQQRIREAGHSVEGLERIRFRNMTGLVSLSSVSPPSRGSSSFPDDLSNLGLRKKVARSTSDGPSHFWRMEEKTDSERTISKVHAIVTAGSTVGSTGPLTPPYSASSSPLVDTYAHRLRSDSQNSQGSFKRGTLERAQMPRNENICTSIPTPQASRSSSLKVSTSRIPIRCSTSPNIPTSTPSSHLPPSTYVRPLQSSGTRKAASIPGTYITNQPAKSTSVSVDTKEMVASMSWLSLRTAPNDDESTPDKNSCVVEPRPARTNSLQFSSALSERLAKDRETHVGHDSNEVEERKHGNQHLGLGQSFPLKQRDEVELSAWFRAQDGVFVEHKELFSKPQLLNRFEECMEEPQALQKNRYGEKEEENTRLGIIKRAESCGDAKEMESYESRAKVAKRHDELGTLQENIEAFHKLLSKLKDLDVTNRLRVEMALKASGGYADVYVGRLVDEAKPVAIKRLRTYELQLNSIKFIKNVLKELRVWSRVQHPNVLPLKGYKAEAITGAPCPSLSFVTEWMEEGSMMQYIRRRAEVDNLSLFEGIADGLHYLHNSGIIHGDLKSANVLISANGTPLLTDFGLSHLITSTSTCEAATDASKGSSRWQAPELITPRDDTDSSEGIHTKESDVWAFGMTGLEVLTKDIPYANLRSEGQVYIAIYKGDLPTNPIDIGGWKLINRKLWEICKVCWVLDPMRRPLTSDLLAEIKRLRD